MKKLLKTLATGALLATSLSAFATETTWNFRTGSEQYGNGSGHTSWGNQITRSVGGVDLTITGWADWMGDNNRVEDGAIATADRGLLNYSGRPDSEGYHHTVGNRNNTNWNNGFSDFLLFSFSQAVNLSNVFLGWSYLNTDFVSVAAYKGEMTDPRSSLASFQRTWQDVVANDIAAKTIVSVSNANSANSGLSSNLSSLSGAASGAVGLAGVFSKHWLVGAYNNAFDTTARHLLSSFKLAGITTHVAPTKPNEPDGTPPSTPANAPGTLALVGLGLVALWRRRAQK